MTHEFYRFNPRTGTIQHGFNTTSFKSSRPSSSSRGNVTEFSWRSARRIRHYLRDCEAEYKVMGTLTYPDSPEYRDCKRHLRCLFERLRRKHRLQGIEDWSYFWFLEFQENGRPHFHFFGTEYIDRAWLAKAWFEIVGSKNEKHLQAGTRIEAIRSGRNGTIVYAIKYAEKMNQKELPQEFQKNGIGRWWGIVGNRKTLAAYELTNAPHRRGGEVQEEWYELKKLIDFAIAAGECQRLDYEYCDVYVFSSEDVLEEIERIFISGQKQAMSNA